MMKTKALTYKDPRLAMTARVLRFCGWDVQPLMSTVTGATAKAYASKWGWVIEGLWVKDPEALGWRFVRDPDERTLARLVQEAIDSRN